MGKLVKPRLEEIAQLIANKGDKENLKDLSKKVKGGIQYQYFTTLSRTKEVKERVLELQQANQNKDILDKKDRLEMLSKIIKEEDDIDIKIKAIQALDKIDNRANQDNTVEKQIIIQLPDNKRN